jgi:3-deoxy-D-manno-octulosonic-acid transferase
MFFIYNILYTLVICILFIPQYFKRPGDLRKKWLDEKMGRLPEAKSAIWIHAVSVGEVNAALPLIGKLKTGYPHCTIVLSTITDTGQKVASERAPEGTRVIYLPFDIRYVLKRSLARVRPRICIIIETELWPNLFSVMHQEGVPVIVLNGRISEASLNGYRRISFFMKRVFSQVKVFGMQSDIDADRLKKIGADEKRISVLGNFKFDMQLPGEIPSWIQQIQGPLLVAGSTHRGEEELVVSAFRENQSSFPELKLIIAPRHPERFAEAEEILRAREIPFIKRSELVARNREPVPFHERIVLLDTVGELSAVYGAADIAIVGKSFTGFGGQNPLEPAYWGKPILCGPHMENFPFITDFYNEGAAFETDASTLGGKIRELLNDPDHARLAGENAKALFMKNSGAVDRALAVIKEYML